MRDETGFYDIYDYYYTPFVQTIHFKIMILFVVLLFVGLIGFLIWRRKKRRLTSWEWALQEIDTLSVEMCSTKKDFKKLYYSLTTIIKQYLHKRYRWRTREKTDEELICYLVEQKFEESLLEDLKKMFSGAVWIKFAGEDVIKTQAKKDLEMAIRIIHKTKQES